MGVPTSEVGYTPAMPRREDHEVHKRHVVALDQKKKVYWKFACVRLLHITVCYIMNTHVSRAFQGSAEQNLLPFVGCSQVFWLKDLSSNSFLSFTTGFLNGCLQWNLWLMVSNRRQLRDNNHFAWLTYVPKMFGYKIYLFLTDPNITTCSESLT